MSWPPLCMSQVSNWLAGPELAVTVTVAVTVVVPVTVTVTESVTVAVTHACGAVELDVCASIC